MISKRSLNIAKIKYTLNAKAKLHVNWEFFCILTPSKRELSDVFQQNKNSFIVESRIKGCIYNSVNPKKSVVVIKSFKI